MAVKRIKVSTINLFGPALIFVIALIAWRYGHHSVAALVGIVGAVAWLIGASTVRVIWRKENHERRTEATDPRDHG
jgi:hypothetical protein